MSFPIPVSVSINTFEKMTLTNDGIIRKELKKNLEKYHYENDHKVRIIEELGVVHGTARIDIAVVNGIMHGYEIKSDKDTLQRLPEQIGAYNSVFNQVTLVVGKSHLFEAFKLVPDWWGIMTARVDENGLVSFNTIRQAEENEALEPTAVAKLLWKDEALHILEEAGEISGLRSKPRIVIYEKLSELFDQDTLTEKVREVLCFRTDWRPDSPLVQNGG